MASIRRTLSPAHQDRPHQNGAAPFSPLSVSSPSYKSGGNSVGSNRYYSSNLISSVSRFVTVFSVPKSSRKGGWRWPLYRCLLCFIFGILFGVAPFGHVDDVRRNDYFFEIKPPHVNAQLGQRNSDVLNSKREEFSVDSVSFGVDTRQMDKISARFDFIPRKQIIVVTPTYNRAMQAYYMNRLGQVLRLLQPPVLWLVVENNAASFETAEMLRKSGVMYRHLVCKRNMTNLKDRGVHQRNTALEHIELHRLDGIVYFADDDNIYSIELLESLRGISRLGTWPVAMLAPGKNRAILEGPVCNGSQVLGWHTNEKSKRLRRFHVDMSGFAFNSTVLWDPKRWHRPFTHPIRQLDTVKEGFQETTFIEQVVEDESQMEGTPPSCSKILNWHLHLNAHGVPYPKGWLLEKNLEAVIPLK